ncbi:DMSO/TMAO reductase YedYZ molybdopterin-dependent catalytic subunit [Humitalea rosea]|uniref:DMSO/TMAO reductase YedYZ molybdopterin-dependent catalytic subunit n=1 Tax=Humitalea rosea TaxID=990373 RepID=A0A2W7ITP6_9PROT|nr:sulfite oxidase-like oxidoreductase [Humitalea rosea]PZW51171.1 DMSO/TMAO reductase YedYZ molybdopterin-dependent catalytic subunit [Humitalea rosea]
MADDVSLTGKVKAKLVATKQAWARDGRLLTGEHGDPEHDRLPPGQTLVKDWPVLDLGVQPTVPEAAAGLMIDGLVEAPQSFDWAALQAMPQGEWLNDIHCVTQWSRYDNRWTGVAMPELLALARPKPEARFVTMESHDGYTTNLPLADLDRPDVLIAFTWEGKPLERQHGGPLRLVLPHLYLWKSPKWLKRITLVAEDQPGFWEVRGYHHRGDPWAEERYA